MRSKKVSLVCVLFVQLMWTQICHLLPYTEDSWWAGTISLGLKQ